MNVKLKIGQLLEKRKTSILTLGNGIALQFLIAFVLSFFLVMLKDNAIGMIVITSISFIWYFIPLIGFFGCYAGINYMRKYGVDYLNVIGVILNLLWLIVVVTIYFYLFYYIGVVAR